MVRGLLFPPGPSLSLPWPSLPNTVKPGNPQLFQRKRALEPGKLSLQNRVLANSNVAQQALQGLWRVLPFTMHRSTREGAPPPQRWGCITIIEEGNLCLYKKTLLLEGTFLGPSGTRRSSFCLTVRSPWFDSNSCRRERGSSAPSRWEHAKAALLVLIFSGRIASSLLPTPLSLKIQT